MPVEQTAGGHRNSGTVKPLLNGYQLTSCLQQISGPVTTVSSMSPMDIGAIHCVNINVIIGARLNMKFALTLNKAWWTTSIDPFPLFCDLLQTLTANRRNVKNIGIMDRLTGCFEFTPVNGTSVYRDSSGESDAGDPVSLSASTYRSTSVRVQPNGLVKVRSKPSDYVMLTDKMGIRHILPLTVTVIKSKVPPVNVAVTETESFGVNEP